MTPMENLDESALLIRLRDREHDFVERKPRGQKGEWLQTAVGFANSTPVGWPAVLFVGVNDNGVPQQGAEALDSLSSSVADVLGQAYPPIYFNIRPLVVSTAACLAVIIPGSPYRPHFAGRPYIRVSHSTKEAPPEVFAEMIAYHSGKAREVLQWVGHKISWARRVRSSIMYSDLPEEERTIVSCNSHYMTCHAPGFPSNLESYPLAWLELGFDHAKNRLRIYLYLDR